MFGIFSKCSYIYLQSYRIIRLLSSKEIGYVKNPLNQDILLQNLKHASSSQNLLKIISTHHKIMNNSHVLQAFRSIFLLQKNDDTSTNNLLQNEHFQTLCVALKSHIRSVEINDLIDTLKIISYVGVPSNSKITQIVLQMIRQNVNQLNLQHIIFLDFLLRQLKPTPLSEALLIAFPIVFEINLPTKMDRDNITHLCDCLQYSVKNKLSTNTIHCLLEVISNHKEISPKNALSITWSICDLKQDESYEHLIKTMLNFITPHCDKLQISELETVLTKLSLRYNKKYQFYFNEKFFETVGDCVIMNDLGFQQAIWILQKFTKVGYSHNKLLDYIATLCHNDLSLLSKSDSWFLYNVVTGFSIIDYRPMHWESVKQAILENCNIFDMKRKFDWIKFATRLALLDIYIPEVLQYVFSDENMKNFENIEHSTAEHFLILYQTLSILRPEYKNYLPDSSYVNYAMESVNLSPTKDIPRPLKGSLERGFGGEFYVLTNVVTKLGHLLHHVIIMRKGGFPVALNITTEENKFLVFDELDIPPESQIVVIYGCDGSYYKNENNIFRTIYPLMFRALETYGFRVIPVCLSLWNDLIDYEKIPYLMQLIKEKTENNNTTVEFARQNI